MTPGRGRVACLVRLSMTSNPALAGAGWVGGRPALPPPQPQACTHPSAPRGRSHRSPPPSHRSLFPAFPSRGPCLPSRAQKPAKGDAYSIFKGSMASESSTKLLLKGSMMADHGVAVYVTIVATGKPSLA